MMSKWLEMCVAFHEDEDAVVATEYMLLLILIACVGMAAAMQFGRTSQDKFQETGNKIGDNQEFGYVEQ